MRRLLIVVFVALPCLAVAQNIYKVQTQDGSILFTDTPPPGSKILEERSGKPTPKVSGAATAAAGAARSAPAPVPSNAGIPTGAVVSIDAAMQEVNAAEAALAVSKRRLELGREPLPGERRGLAGGGSRLTEDYQARVAGLEREVADAEARLQRAYAARNAAR